MEREEGGGRGEKKEESKEVTVRSFSVPPIQGPSEETKYTGKGKAE